jgi:hypothetical protein
MKKILLLLVLLSSINVFGQICVEFVGGISTKDSYIESASPNVNFSSHPNFQAAIWTAQGNPYVQRSIIEFDLTSIPTNAIIDSASLYLFADPTNMQGGHYGTGNSGWLRRITQAWNVNTVTWNNQPAYNTTDEVNIPAPLSQQQDYVLDVSTIAQGMVSNPSSNFGFLLMLQDEVNYYKSLIFCSSDNLDSARFPKLKVCYTLPQNCVEFAGPTVTTDVYFHSYSPNTNDPLMPNFQAATWTAQGNPMIQRSVIEFDLTSVPASAIIDSASLYLYADPTNMQGGHYGTGNSGWLRRITQAWNLNTVTWNNQPGYNSIDEVNIAAPLSQQQNYVLDVTAMVSDMVNNPSSNFGFLLMMQDEVNTYKSLIFCSSDYPDSARFPRLKVCYKMNPEGVSEFITSSPFSIYPNPSNGNITIAFQDGLKNGTLEVFNSIGQEIYSDKISGSISKKDINLNAATGIYFVKVNDEEKVFTKKLVIE